MSSLSRNLYSRSFYVSGFLSLATLGHAWGADAYFIPEVRLEAEHQTDIDMGGGSPTQDSSIEGYSAYASGIIGFRTPRNVTEIRPRLQYADYPKRDELRRTNGYLDFNSQYNTQRSDFDLVGSYWREDSLRLIQTEAQFDEFDPENPTVDTPNRTALLTDTRTRIQLRPSYTYDFTQRLGGQINLLYEKVDFDSESSSRSVDYDYLYAMSGLLWSVAPRTSLGTGVYTSKFESEDEDQVTSKGVDFELQHNWSPTFVGTAGLELERTEVESPDLVEEDVSNNWGLNVGVSRRGEVSRLRFNLGRTFSPSGAGARTVIDQLRVQYNRNLSARWAYSVATRIYRNRQQGHDVDRDSDRNYARAELQLNWNMTRTWYLTGGYSYFWRKYLVDAESADNHLIKVGITYRGLNPQ